MKNGGKFQISKMKITKHQLQKIIAEALDLDLEKGDVRLTMGGEPTFVSVEDFESEEWTTAANGEQKPKIADQLIRRLRDRFAPGGLLH